MSARNRHQLDAVGSGIGLFLTVLVLLGGCGSDREGPPRESQEVERPPATETVRAEPATYEFFVRVRPEADPEAVATEYGLQPDTASDSPVHAFRASFTKELASRLREDPRVRSVSVRAEEEGWRPPEGRTVPDDSPPDTSAAGR